MEKQINQGTKAELTIRSKSMVKLENYTMYMRTIWLMLVVAHALFASNLENGIKAEDSKNFAEAKNYFEKSCDENNMDGCNRLGILYHTGSGTERNYQKANEIYEKACELGGSKGCSNLAMNYANGNGAQKDYAKALELYEKASKMSSKTYDNTSGNAAAYFGIANLYLFGQGVKSDFWKASDAFSKACELKHQKACTILSIINGNNKLGGDSILANIFKIAIDDLNKTCTQSNSKTCRSFGVEYYESIQKITQPQLKAGGIKYELVKYTLKTNKSIRSTTAKAIQSLEDGCTKGVVSECKILASIYTDDLLINADTKKAEEFAKKAENRE